MYQVTGRHSWECQLVSSFLTEVYWIYNGVLGSGIQQSDSVIHMCVYIYTFPGSFLLWFIIRYCIYFPVLYSRLSLVCFIQVALSAFYLL